MSLLSLLSLKQPLEGKGKRKKIVSIVSIVFKTIARRKKRKLSLLSLNQPLEGKGKGKNCLYCL